MHVRAYTDGDAAVCAALFEELVETHRRLYPGSEIGGTFLPAGEAFVVEDDGEIVGYAGLIWHGQRAELEPIVVSPTHRGRGAGRMLVERLVEAARAGGAVRLFARPVGRNDAAIAFFHTVGLDVVGRVEVQLDFAPRETRAGPTLADRRFRV